MEYTTLRNGLEIPMLGFGVFQMSNEETEKCVLEAIEAGYRLIDTAQSYRNEDGVGNAILKCGLSREELIISTKVWYDNYGYEKTKASLIESLKKLKTDYIDIVLLHQPFNDTYGAYRALEEFYKEGKIKAIGVSNFYPDRLSDICAFTEIAPLINQVEVNVFNQQISAQANMIKNGVQIQAWAPFGEGRNNMFTNPTLKEIGERHHKSIAQIILRWLLQRKVISLAKTVNKERMIENLNIFDFDLSVEDMVLIESLDTKESLFFNHQSVEAVERFVELAKKRRD